jgi:3-oxoadipate enol-lactonase
VRRLELPELTLAYEDTGGGEPAIVFVHGLGGCAYVWWAQVADAGARGYRAIAYDQRGAGLSSHPPGPYSVELWAEDLERLLDGVGVDRAAIVGHSVGCVVSEHAAHRLGERAWALALCGGRVAWPSDGNRVFEQRASLARQRRMDEIAEAVATTGLSEAGRRANPALHGLVLRMLAANDPEGYAESALATGRGAMRDPAALAVPTLAFAGSKDPVTPPESAREIAAAAGGEHAVVDGAAHWCMLERPDAVNALLFGFLERQSPAGR